MSSRRWGAGKGRLMEQQPSASRVMTVLCICVVLALVVLGAPASASLVDGSLTIDRDEVAVLKKLDEADDEVAVEDDLDAGLDASGVTASNTGSGTATATGSGTATASGSNTASAGSVSGASGNTASGSVSAQGDASGSGNSASLSISHTGSESADSDVSGSEDVGIDEIRRSAWLYYQGYVQ